MTRLAFLLALASLALPLSAKTPMTTLTISVKDIKGKPVDRAAVIIQFSKGRSVVKFGKNEMTSWELRTNQEGLIHLPSIRQGHVEVQVIAKGYQTYGNKYDINEEEKTIDITLNPPQQQYSAHH
ncbi:MAG TPA: hypothetical protein VN610_08335 [Bryobacteraceae bacterium]|nr:hypothetical protein [Bryobacteraceae bacterium]